METILSAKKGKSNLSTANNFYSSDYHNQVISQSILFNVEKMYVI